MLSLLYIARGDSYCGDIEKRNWFVSTFCNKTICPNVQSAHAQKTSKATHIKNSVKTSKEPSSPCILSFI